MTLKRQAVDFTQGSIIRNLIAFSVPILLGELLQNLYNSVDALAVGNYAGESALAAVTVCSFISQLIVSFFNGMSVGSNVVVSRAFGAGDRQELDRSIQVSFTFSALLGLILSLLGILFAPLLLQLVSAGPEVFDEALIYLRIYLAGVLFIVIYNSGAGILRAIGDSGTPFYFLAAACTINIVLDIVLVKYCRMGVAGAGIATVVSQGISVGCVYRAINRRRGICCFSLRALGGEGKRIIFSILDIGVAAGLQGALISLSNLVIARYINRFSTASIAGIGIAQRIDKFIVLPTKSFGITMTTYVSQNLGAKRYDRIRDGCLRCTALSFAITLGMSALVYVFTGQCVSIFNTNPEVIRVGSATLHVFLPFLLFMAIRELLLGILRGYKRARTPMILSLIGMIGVRQLFLSVAMSRGEDIRYIFWCYPIAWASTAILLLIYFLAVKKKLTGLNGNADNTGEDMTPA